MNPLGRSQAGTKLGLSRAVVAAGRASANDLCARAGQKLPRRFSPRTLGDTRSRFYRSRLARRGGGRRQTRRAISRLGRWLAKSLRSRADGKSSRSRLARRSAALSRLQRRGQSVWRARTIRAIRAKSTGSCAGSKIANPRTPDLCRRRFARRQYAVEMARRGREMQRHRQLSARLRYRCRWIWRRRRERSTPVSKDLFTRAIFSTCLDRWRWQKSRRTNWPSMRARFAPV